MKLKFTMFFVGMDIQSTTKEKDIDSICELAMIFFKEKEYSEHVKTYIIDFTCICHDLDKNMVRRPKYYSDKTINPPRGLEMCDPVRIVQEFECGVALDKSFAYTNKQEGYNFIAHAVLDYLENLKYPIAIRKSFDKERFNNDMREFFRGIGCDV
ncbi:MAG: hypothetical protein NC344_04770 [Bacteroidales bacterium]|nr:hypothetical protein [Bacteroidales bacterium]MCM1147138.1 hypothetical protein [Bacteroidales bacterium]MCM1205364.1 hypothetical protein [Bacillota bacterium]MCM1509831.1 hypothetical protein [Clostridium sp.]